MHIIIQSLKHLIDIPKEQYDDKLQEIESHIHTIDINEVPQNEFRELYAHVVSVIENGSVDQKFNAIKLLGYLSHVETLAELNFGGYIKQYENLLKTADPHLYGPTHELIDHIEEIFREYTHRTSEPEEFAEYTTSIQTSMQKDIIDLLFRMQDLEKELEDDLDTDDTDRSHDFGVVYSMDTRDTRLRLVRQ